MKRAFSNADLWSAIRGCRLMTRPLSEVEAVRDRHRDNPDFAGRVLHEAARQVLFLRGGERRP